MFEKNDAILSTAQKIVKGFCVVGALLCIAVGIVLCVTYNQKQTNPYYGIEIEVTNYYQLIGGIALILFGSLIFWSIWIFSQLVFSTICDIKLIRNKLYGLNNDNLQSFMDEDDDDDDDDEDENDKEEKDNKANKKKSLLQKLRDL